MTTRLKLYNEALRICGETSLASLTEDREPRHLLDEVWDNGGVKACLEAGQWRFALRTIQLDYDADITPEFGLQRAFQKPTDWCATSSVSANEYFENPLLNYVDEAGYWYADEDVIYVRYISNHADWGGDLSTWTEKFSDYAASYFARKIILKLTSDKERMELVYALEKDALMKAKNHDAMGDPTKFPPEGSWSRSRRSMRGDRGSRHRLIG